ncbi:uncharacterized protein I206_107643 [Kwoniella pini CBS 10737]|uniref:Homeobox domain-containing protein n=1 Tax=Kwoniella pini CBS 10737 TaxID=1296096 RepID=A0A1B9HXX5_9TREE|nr:uncharacterized protein I206_05978 [Kwoniella pini CBS 10737]OCF48110.1 hypothetical protein I206_05978 [Kwoniella pini CBS 10737]
MASSPEISPQTPRMSVSPPLRHLSMSVSAASSRHGSIPVYASPPRDIRALLSHSPPISPISIKMETVNPDSDSVQKGYIRSTVSPPSFSRDLPPLQPSVLPTLPRLTVPRPLAGHRPSGPSKSGRGTGFGLDAFKLGSPPKSHPQPIGSPSHNHSRSFWIPSSQIRNEQRPQHQRLASLPSLKIGHNQEPIYPTPVSIASQRGFSRSTITPATHTHRAPHEYQVSSKPYAHYRSGSTGYSAQLHHRYGQPVLHRQHPSSGDQIIRIAPHPLPQGTWAAPPPPPAPAMPISTRTQNMVRPRLHIHPYAHAMRDPRYHSADGPGLGSQTQFHPGLAHHVSISESGRESIFTSPSSGISPGSFKAPRKRADDSQLAILSDIFEKTAYPSTDERDELARKLGMTSRSVQIWFQNRRRAVKVDAKSAVQRAEAEADTQVMIRGPAPIVARPYPVHSRHHSEGQEVLPPQPVPATSIMPERRPFPPHPIVRPPLIASQSDITMVKKEIMTP